jgi:hypothetical protein
MKNSLVARIPMGRSAVLAVAMVLAAAAASADEVSDTWTRVYRRMPNLEQKYQVMQNIAALDNPDLVPLLTDALGELLGVRETRSSVDEGYWNSLVRLISKKLGELKAAEAGPLLMRVATEAREPAVRADALMAIGYAGATDLAGDVALFLRNVVLARASHPEGEETLVYGAVVALEALGQEVGYAPVFAVLRAGYSQSITKLADDALGNMLADPIPVLAGVERNEEDLSVKLAALRLGLRSKAPAASKASLAVTAFEQGLVRPGSSQAETTGLRALRMEAMAALVSTGAAGAPLPEAVAVLAGRTLGLDTDTSERLQAIDALQAAGGDRAGTLLTAYLQDMNDRQEAGMSAQADQIRVFTAAIQALGALGVKAALP